MTILCVIYDSLMYIVIKLFLYHINSLLKNFYAPSYYCVGNMRNAFENDGNAHIPSIVVCSILSCKLRLFKCDILQLSNQLCEAPNLINKSTAEKESICDLDASMRAI